MKKLLILGKPRIHRERVNNTISLGSLTRFPGLSYTPKMNIVSSRLNRYRSFPTSALNHRGEIVVAYRDAVFTGESLPLDYGEHGLHGDTYLLKYNIKRKRSSIPVKLYDHSKTGSNEQHAILSGEGKKLYLFSRQYGGSDRIFLSISEDGGETFSPRWLARIKEFASVACYGRLREFQGRLIAPVYGNPADPALYPSRLSAAWICSENDGKDWQFGGWIGRAVEGGPSFNETAMIRLKDGGWLAVIRTGEAGYRLFYSFAGRNLKKWTPPKPLGFKGEAPELYDLGDGRIALTHRGVVRSGKFTWSLRISKDQGRTWGRARILDEYGGSRFHGGYGDINPVGGGKWMGICYSPGPTGFPGIRGVTFRLKKWRRHGK